MFVFDDLDSLSKVWGSNKWGAHFEDEYLADVGVWAKKSTKVDAAWISDIIGHQGQLLPGWEAAAINYWSGRPKSEIAPIWEMIVEGSFCIWSMHSKQEALKNICAIWPNSIGLLMHSMNCYALGSQDGQSFPGIVRDENGISLNYFLRMVDSKEAEFCERLIKLPLEDPQLFAGNPDPNKMHLPDLRGFSRTICPENDKSFTNLLALLSKLLNTSNVNV